MTLKNLAPRASIMDITNLASDAETFTSNAFLIGEHDLVDPGADPIIVEQLSDTNLQTIVITHSHHDHIENLEPLLDQHNAIVWQPCETAIITNSD